jgi:hypothetical protein
MQGCGQPDAQAAPPLGKGPPVPTEHDTWYTTLFAMCLSSNSEGEWGYKYVGLITQLSITLDPVLNLTVFMFNRRQINLTVNT